MTEQLITHLLHTHRQALPVLDNIVVLLPGPEACGCFYRQLLEELPDNKPAVIPPWCGTLQNWVDAFILLPDPDITVISEQSRRILFIEALQQHPGLFREENKWQVTLSLLKLFDEINLHNIDMPASADAWIETVRRAYGIDQPHAHLVQEASLIHTLWHAWYQQLHAGRQLDSSSAYAISLGRLAASPPEGIHFYVLDSTDYTPAEQACLNSLHDRGLCTLFDSEQTTGSEPEALSEFIEQAFNYHEMPLLQRAQHFARHHQLTALPFSLYKARNAETETRAVDIKIRQWLLAGKKNIAVICEDRRLSRRLRALLERANVPLHDLSGWSLATTSATAVLERWLECIEQDFDYRPMLDLLKSHFFGTGDHEQHLKNVYRLEADIIIHENIGQGLSRYKKHLDYRLNKLEHWPRNSYDEIFQLLERLHKSAAALLKLYHAKYPARLGDFVDALIDSLHQLGLYENFMLDPAGALVVENVTSMQQSLAVSNPRLNWSDFRTWLATTLEETLFRPPVAATPVRLMTLDQAGAQRFDALVIAAADDQHLPGYADSSPFFNQGVRQSLGLPAWEQRREQRIRRFKQLLTSAPEILITCKSEDNGEPVVLSPWITSLDNFAELATGRSLQDRTLDDACIHAAEVFICDTDALPNTMEQPAPAAGAQQIPDKVSASGHQRLIDCPYQYFASDVLGLKPAEEIIDELKKSDYGERVHRILQAFHTPVKNLPAPFDRKLTEQNRKQAEQHLIELSHIVFSRDLEENVLHRSWLHRWLDHIPAYLNWQIEQQKNWTVTDTEQRIEIRHNDRVTITGRLDRIDSDGALKSIIDYKTGRIARQNDVDCGEDVQLATYSLLIDDATEVKYLSLDEKDGKVQTAATLADEQLNAMRAHTGERLTRLFEMLRGGQTMPAWGDEATCKHCDYTGLCRKPAWDQ